MQAPNSLQVWAISADAAERLSLRRRMDTRLRYEGLLAQVSGLCPARCRSAIRGGRRVDLALVIGPGDAGMALVQEIRAAYPRCGILWGSDRDDSLLAWRMEVDYFFLLPLTREKWDKGLRLWIQHRAFT